MKVIEKKVNNHSKETEEKTALSLLMALRIRFTKESNKDQQYYSSKEMSVLLTEIMKNINKVKIRDFGREAELMSRYTNWEDEIWGAVYGAIKRSKIVRYPWNDILGMSLTKAIHICRNSGKDVHQTFKEISSNDNVLEFIQKNERHEQKILSNLEISIHARYGENNTAEKLKDLSLEN